MRHEHHHAQQSGQFYSDGLRKIGPIGGNVKTTPVAARPMMTGTPGPRVTLPAVGGSLQLTGGLYVTRPTI